MLIAGNFGAKKTRLALVPPEFGPRRSATEQKFMSADFAPTNQDRDLGQLDDRPHQPRGNNRVRRQFAFLQA